MVSLQYHVGLNITKSRFPIFEILIRAMSITGPTIEFFRIEILG